jgi:hypothetical protein
MKTRDERVKELAWAIYRAIRETQRGVSLWTEAPERGHDVTGAVVYEGLDNVGFDGEFDLISLADALFGRIS